MSLNPLSLGSPSRAAMPDWASGKDVYLSQSPFVGVSFQSDCAAGFRTRLLSSQSPFVGVSFQSDDNNRERWRSNGLSSLNPLSLGSPSRDWASGKDVRFAVLGLNPLSLGSPSRGAELLLFQLITEKRLESQSPFVGVSFQRQAKAKVGRKKKGV